MFLATICINRLSLAARQLPAKLLVFWTIVLSATLPASAQQEEGFESLFDGQTLKGWSGLEDLWSVEDGAITGRTTADKPIDGNTFLIWQGEDLEDFELRLQFRIESGNSGIQYRSQDLGEYRVGGYQADIDASFQYVGILYEERGRGILAQRGTRVVIEADGASEVEKEAFSESQLLESLRKNDWNEYVILAQGNRLTQTLNGITSVEVIDHNKDAARARGILALQLHAGPPMKVQFKDILLKRLDAASPAEDSDDSAVPAPDGTGQMSGACPCIAAPCAGRPLPRLHMRFRCRCG